MIAPSRVTARGVIKASVQREMAERAGAPSAVRSCRWTQWRHGYTPSFAVPARRIGRSACRSPRPQPRRQRRRSPVQILIIRHASAEERSAFAATGKSDDRRPLTDEGRRKMTEAAQGLRALVPHLDVIAASPLVRAQQTAAIVAKACRIADVETTSTLTPDAQPASFAKWAQAHVNHDVVAAVGHEPHLGTLVTWLLSGRTDSHVVDRNSV